MPKNTCGFSGSRTKSSKKELDTHVDVKVAQWEKKREMARRLREIRRKKFAKKYMPTLKIMWKRMSDEKMTIDGWKEIYYKWILGDEDEGMGDANWLLNYYINTEL